RAVENTRTVFLMLSPAPLAQSSAALVLASTQSALSLQPSAQQQVLSSPPERNARAALPPHAQLLTRVEWRFELVRSRYAERKPPQRAASANVIARAHTLAG